MEDALEEEEVRREGKEGELASVRGNILGSVLFFLMFFLCDFYLRFVFLEVFLSVFCLNFHLYCIVLLRHQYCRVSIFLLRIFSPFFL